MKELMQSIQTYMGTSNSVVLEAAHIYADKQPNCEQQKGAVLAAAVYSGVGIPAIRTLLIDDYNVSEKTLDINAYLVWLTDHGYAPDEVIMETDLVPAAHELLEEIRDTVPAKKLSTPKYDPWQKNGALGLWTSVGKVSLLTTGGRPSCALLDAALYLRKSQLAPICLTVLPQEYSTQQVATHAILKRISKSVPVVNLYFNPAGETEQAVSFNQ
jgi:hypothetical protein